MDHRRIHGVDQRAAQVTYSNKALAKDIDLHQKGAGTPGFKFTSTVVWPLARLMADWLCEHQDILSNRSVLELGSGIGLVALVANGLGCCKKVTATDADISLLEINASEGMDIRELVWGKHSEEQEQEPYDVILASDVVYNQGEEVMEALVATAAAYSKSGTRFLMSYEHRSDWSALSHFWNSAERHGFQGGSTAVDGWEDDMLLIDLTKQ